MSKVFLDTHVVVWYLLDSPRLSATARQLIQDAVASDGAWVSAISILEVGYLVEKGKLPTEAFDRFLDFVARMDAGLHVAALDTQVARAATEKISRESIPDMPDRIIAATALVLNIPLITHDARIRAAGINVLL